MLLFTTRVLVGPAFQYPNNSTRRRVYCTHAIFATRGNPSHHFPTDGMARDWLTLTIISYILEKKHHPNLDLLLVWLILFNNYLTLGSMTTARDIGAYNTSQSWTPPTKIFRDRWCPILSQRLTTFSLASWIRLPRSYRASGHSSIQRR